MTQAVISLAGKQYLVSEGETLKIDKHVDTEEGKDMNVNEVLLATVDDKVLLGMPYVKDASVSLKVIKLGKGEKVTTARFRAKSRYRRKVGHRQPQTVLEVSKIVLK